MTVSRMVRTTKMIFGFTSVAGNTSGQVMIHQLGLSQRLAAISYLQLTPGYGDDSVKGVIPGTGINSLN